MLRNSFTLLYQHVWTCLCCGTLCLDILIFKMYPLLLMMISEYIGEEEVFDETPAAEREFRQTQTLPLRSGSFVKLKLPARMLL